MRFFDRSSLKRPKILDTPRVRERRETLSAFVREARSSSQQRRPPIDRSIHTYPELRNALLSGFQSKCAYCESDLRSADYTICNHRPAGFAAGVAGKTDLLHYVWLAYDWDNLYPVCAVCNRTKGNAFPIEGERGPLNASVEALRSIEKELLLDPCKHDPSDHLRFFPDGYVKPRSLAGEMTIDLLNLNRETLVEQRQDVCGKVAAIIGAGAEIDTLRTGLSSPRGGEILDMGMPHAGATTLAVLDAAGSVELPANSLSSLFSLLRSAPAAGERFLDAFRPGVAGARGDGTRGKRSSKTAPTRAGPRRSRAFRVDRQPLAKHPIKSVHIRNFKALESIRFELPVQVDDPELTPCMIILGENAAGKSSVLEAVTLALLGVDEITALDRLIPEEEVSPKDAAHRPDPENWELVGSESVTVEIRYHGIDEVTSVTGGTRDLRFKGSRGTAKVLLAYGPRRFFSTKRKRHFRAPAYRVRSLFDPMATISNPNEWLAGCPKPVFDAAVRAMREILVLGDKGDFIRDDNRIFVRTENGRLPLSELSVGYKSVIALATDIMRELSYHYDNLEHANAVVVIDEIETHLHPRWKMLIVGALRKAFPKVQFIITTHDPLCLRGMYPGEVFVLRRREDNDRVEQLEDLPDVRGMRAEQILMSEFFGLGSTDPETDAKLIRYHDLVARGAEPVEAEQLRVELSTRMKVGDTIQEQVTAEAVRQIGLDPLEPLGKFKSKPRKDMVDELLTVLRAPLESGREPAE